MQWMEEGNRQEGDFNRQDEGNGRRGRRRGMGWDGDERADTRSGGHEARADTRPAATLTLPLRTRLLGVGLSALWGTANQNYP